MGVSGKPRSVLIVDDSASMRRFLRRVLERSVLGFEIFREAASGVEALEVASKERPDLILSDWDMSNLNGEQLLARLRTAELGAIPVIVVSSVAGADLLKLGARGYVRKPFTPAALVEEVRRVLDLTG